MGSLILVFVFREWSDGSQVCARLIQASDRDTFTYGVFRDTLFWSDDTLFGGLPTGQFVFGLLSLFIKETNRTYRHRVPESFQDRRVCLC